MGKLSIPKRPLYVLLRGRNIIHKIHYVTLLKKRNSRTELVLDLRYDKNIDIMYKDHAKVLVKKRNTKMYFYIIWK